MADTATSLSDEQINELLEQAEVRLLQKQQAQQGKGIAPRTSKNVVVKSNSTDASVSQPTTSTPSKAKAEELSVRVPEARKSKKEMAHKADAGPQWFNLPATDLTPQLRRDLQLLKMRDVLDPKRHYKKDTTRAIPEFAQVGTVVPGPTDYFSSRMTKKERKRTLLEDVLETEAASRRFKNKYGEIQAAKTSGKKAHYKKMMQKRYGRNYKG
ncbi:Fcf2 pre-rRNA processing-domain-containing protein [Xylaria bambusicola]|uniref:Fcf2 pre-rRNA processing-domain-containing protein n=1 Tax=Xylaria bambusicola TaxID=326684 RepID=UPI002008BFAF|nr:Fcf2 pre-rRNA processing-domain-containing protein [Xylaria bambusicola]KAI0527856.1 Fcf2 pre-rRNA processing-domain-containing protein [Xylaria bambusicola]